MVLHMLGNTGVVNQRVEPAETGCSVGDPPAVGILGYVALGDLDLGSGGTHGIGRRLCLCAALGIVEQHGLGPTPGGTDRDGRPETGG